MLMFKYSFREKQEGRTSGTHSRHNAPQISAMLTPRSFFTIVHHGVAFVMMMTSDIRGKVATSSFTVNGSSRSGLSALKPPVWPAVSSN